MIDVVRRLIRRSFEEDGLWWLTTDNTAFPIEEFEEAVRWQQMLLDKEGVKIIYAE